jgi:hypothetical protein
MASVNVVYVSSFDTPKSENFGQLTLREDGVEYLKWKSCPPYAPFVVFCDWSQTEDPPTKLLLLGDYVQSPHSGEGKYLGLDGLAGVGFAIIRSIDNSILFRVNEIGELTIALLKGYQTSPIFTPISVDLTATAFHPVALTTVIASPSHSLETFRKGSLAVTVRLDGSALKLLIIGQNGRLFDADASIAVLNQNSSAALDTPLQNGDIDYTALSWRAGALRESAHQYSALAAVTCKISHEGMPTGVYCFFYQGQDGSILCRRFSDVPMQDFADGKHTSDYNIATCNLTRCIGLKVVPGGTDGPHPGTSLAAHSYNDDVICLWL